MTDLTALLGNARVDHEVFELRPDYRALLLVWRTVNKCYKL